MNHFIICVPAEKAKPNFSHYHIDFSGGMGGRYRVTQEVYHSDGYCRHRLEGMTFQKLEEAERMWNTDYADLTFEEFIHKLFS